MNGLRAAEAPALTQEPLQSANPLLALIPDDRAEVLIIEALQRLACDAQSARWIEELLEDQRLSLLDGVREEAVRVLLNFGHPYALLITPEDLSRFRRLRPVEIVRGRIGVAAVVGTLFGFWRLHAERFPSLEDLVTLGLATVWSIAVGLRTLGRSPVTRRSLMIEVTLGLAASATVIHFFSLEVGIGVLAVVLPIALTGLFGGWKED